MARVQVEIDQDYNKKQIVDKLLEAGGTVLDVEDSPDELMVYDLEIEIINKIEGICVLEVL